MLAPKLPIEHQVQIVIQALDGKRYEKETPIFQKALEWIERFPAEVDQSLKRRLIDNFCAAFSVTEAEIYAALTGDGRIVQQVAEIKSNEADLRALLPKGGWFEWYDAYTSKTESPLSYHMFSSLCVLGAALGRRVWLDMGFFKIYPNYAVVLVGPPGIKKTSCTDIAKSLVDRATLCPVMADKITPESMASTLKKSGHHFIYAPELSVLLGKQRYNEGLTSQMLRLLDSPDKFVISTMARQEEFVYDIAITFLGCTTPSLLSSSMPAEVSSNGFLSRLILVVEKTAERIIYRPKKGPFEDKIIATVERLKGYAGEMDFSPEADQLSERWYNQLQKTLNATTDEALREMRARAQTHVIRTAMLVHLAQCDDLKICATCFQTAINLVKFVEDNAPSLMRSIKQTSGSGDTDYVVEMLRRLGGATSHSNLLRKVGSRMDTTRLKQHIRTLEESEKIKVSRKMGSTIYTLTEEGLKREMD